MLDVIRVKKMRRVCTRRVFLALAITDVAKINYTRVQYTEDFI